MSEPALRPGRTNARQTPSREAVAARFREQYPDFQYSYVEFFANHLADCSREFGGDLQQLLVLAIIGQVYLRAYLDAATRAPGVPTAHVDASIGASRLSDVTGIPRQTVRRKLALLEERGWVERVNGSSWALCFKQGESNAKRGLAGLDARSIERIAALYCGLARIVEDPPRQR